MRDDWGCLWYNAHGDFFDRLQFLRGLENFLVDLLTDPHELRTLIGKVLDYNMRYIDRWLEAGGIDAIWFHGDVGDSERPAHRSRHLQTSTENP